MKNVSSGITACFGDATPARRPVPSTRTRYATASLFFRISPAGWADRPGKPGRESLWLAGPGGSAAELGHMPRQKRTRLRHLLCYSFWGAVSLINERVRFSLVCCRVVGRPDINGFPSCAVVRFTSPKKPGQKQCFCPGFSSFSSALLKTWQSGSAVVFLV